MCGLSTISDNLGMADKHQEWDCTCRKTATVHSLPLFHYDDVDMWLHWHNWRDCWNASTVYCRILFLCVAIVSAYI